MPRNGSGTYTLPAGNPVESGTLIEATWANDTLSDMANEITDSLSRSGEGGMLAPFRLADGTLGSPGIAWLNETSTGFYRAGTNEMWAAVGGTQIQQFTINGTVARFAAGSVTTPSITAFGDTNTGMYFPAADQIAFSTAGVQRLLINATGTVTIPGNFSLGGTFSAASFSGSGASLTDLNATNVTSGTLTDTRLSANVALLNAANSFTAAQTITVANDAQGLIVKATGARFNVMPYDSYSSAQQVYLSATNAAGSSLAKMEIAASDLILSGSTITLGTEPLSNFATLSAQNTFTGSTQTVYSDVNSPIWYAWTTSALRAPGLWLHNTAGLSKIYQPAGSSTLMFAVNSNDRFSISGSGNYDFKSGTVTTDNASASEVGFKGVPQNSQSTNYTCVLSDAGKHILHPSSGGSGDTFTIPANSSVAYPVGTVLTFVNADSNSVSIAITTDTMTLAGSTTTGTRTLGQNGIATAIKVTSTAWLISGTALT